MLNIGGALRALDSFSNKPDRSPIPVNLAYEVKLLQESQCKRSPFLHSSAHGKERNFNLLHQFYQESFLYIHNWAILEKIGAYFVWQIWLNFLWDFIRSVNATPVIVKIHTTAPTKLHYKNTIPLKASGGSNPYGYLTVVHFYSYDSVLILLVAISGMLLMATAFLAIRKA